MPSSSSSTAAARVETVQVSVHHLHREILCVLGKERHLILAEIIGNDLELGG